MRWNSLGYNVRMAENDPLPDENRAPYVPSDVAPTCYHCPNTSCDGHYYLRRRELGQKMICPKCGLTVIIGTRAGGSSLWLRYVGLLVIGALIGFLIAAAR